MLRTYRLGEADRIVVLLTSQRGKVRAVAKGVRKTGSRFGGRLEPASHVNLLLYEGRQLDVVSQADTVEHFAPLRSDLRRARDSLALLEATDHVAQEGAADRPLFVMLTAALRTLAERPSPLLVAAYYWKLLAHDGSAPMLDACVRCGGNGPFVALDPTEGGVLCRGCLPTGGARRAVHPEALELLRRVGSGGLAGALAAPAGPAVAEATDIATHALEAHLERRLRVPRLLERGG